MPGVAGRSGRKRKPTALRAAMGNPGHRPLPTNEPTPTPGVPDAPASLRREEREVWDRVVPELKRMGVLSKMHREIIASYCRAEALECRAAAALRKEGEVIKAPFGPKKNPWMDILDKAEKRKRAIAVEFGMTPSSQARATKVIGGDGIEDEKEPDNPALRLLKRANAARSA